MIVHGFDAGHVLGKHLESAAITLIKDRAPKIDNAFVDGNLNKRDRRPFLSVQFGLDVLLNIEIGLSRWLSPLLRTAAWRAPDLRG